MHAADRNTNCVQHNKTHVDKSARCRANSRPRTHNDRKWSASVRTPSRDRNSRHECRDPNTTLQHETRHADERARDSSTLEAARSHENADMMGVSGLCHKPWITLDRSDRTLTAIGSCVSRDQLCLATGQEYFFEWDVSTLMERDHFQPLKPCVLLSSSHKVFVWHQKAWNATRLVCNVFILLVYGPLFAINTCDCTCICLCVFYIVQRRVGLGAGVGLGAPTKVKCIYNYFIFLQMHANY